MYVFPFADHVYELHVFTVSEPEVEFVIVKFKVAIESQPFAAVKVAV